MPLSRRDFLKAGTLAVAAGGTGQSTSQSRPIQYGMVIDLRKCIGCKTCAVACKAENRTPPGVNYMVVLEMEIGRYPNVRRMFVPRPCMHCQQPSCTQVCPTQATYRRPDGVVVVDYDKCIGCRYCITACPYGARSFDFGHEYPSACSSPVTENGERTLQANAPYVPLPSPEYGENRPTTGHASPYQNVRKCHFCLHRVKRGLLPACAAACPGRAIFFGDLNDPNSIVYRVRSEEGVFFPRFPNRNVMQLKPEIGNDPAVYYLT